MLGGWGDALGAGVRDLRDALTCRLDQLRATGEKGAAAVIGTARTLAYQYGTPPEVGAARLAPRNMTDLPFIREREVTEQTTVNVYQEAARYGFAGYVANIGADEFRVSWLGVDGSVSESFTVPPSATVQVPCIVSGVVVLPVDGAPARFQVSLS